MSAVRFIDRALDKACSIALVTGVFLMLFLAVGTIVLRWMETSYPWMEQAVRHLVFLSTFLGGVVATGRGSHIGIDILERYLKTQGHHKLYAWLERFIFLVAVVVLIWLTKASWGFMQIEFEYGKVAFLGIHSGFLVGIIPAGFGLISFRFFLMFLLSFEKRSES
jgi:TRAP-type C4-dicarboxylate transport system permease small subunit